MWSNRGLLCDSLQDSEKFFFSYLCRSYEGFLAGNDDEEAQDAELQERFDL